MKKKFYDPEDVLMAVIEHYAKNECTDFSESVQAQFIDTEDGPCVELFIDKEDSSDDTVPKRRSKKVLN